MKEDILPNTLEPRVENVQINAFVDVDHVRDKITRRSQMGIIVFMN